LLADKKVSLIFESYHTHTYCPEIDDNMIPYLELILQFLKVYHCKGLITQDLLLAADLKYLTSF
jgi:hypothetical protein